jgi:hypothetical protein
VGLRAWQDMKINIYDGAFCGRKSSVGGDNLKTGETPDEKNKKQFAQGALVKMIESLNYSSINAIR